MALSPKQVIDKFNKKHHAKTGDVLFIERLRKSGFTEKQMASIVEALDGLCYECFCKARWCLCWDDR